jgi:hypothetical protein
MGSISTREFMSTLVFVAFVSCAVGSGLAYPFDFGRGFWPWSSGWFMFSADDGYDYVLLASGETESGATVPVEVDAQFRFRVGSTRNRFQEIPRGDDTLRRMAAFLCRQGRFKSVTFTDSSWWRAPGRRLSIGEVPKEDLHVATLRSFPCNR